jgi:hypothetical protein
MFAKGTGWSALSTTIPLTFVLKKAKLQRLKNIKTVNKNSFFSV